MTRENIVIIGSGMMGSGIAAVSALAGNKTVLADVDVARAQKGLEKALECVEELLKNELATPEAAARAKDLITPCGDYHDALPSARLVIEAIVENMEAKQAMFKELDSLLPEDVCIASNTSGLRITEIAALTAHPERAVTAHFWFPAHLVPLVEVVMGDKTDEKIAQSLKDELAAWGKAPVLVKKDLPGQLANRILQAIIRESVNIVEMGLASPEDVDTAVKMGMGIRFPAWGPLEHVDGVGVDLCRSVQNTVLPGIGAGDKAAPMFDRLVEEGNLGSKTGKGFYDWNVRSMDELAKKRNEFIIYALKKIR